MDVSSLYQLVFHHSMLDTSGFRSIPIFIPLTDNILRIKFILVRMHAYAGEPKEDFQRGKDILYAEILDWIQKVPHLHPDHGPISYRWFDKVVFTSSQTADLLGPSLCDTFSSNVFMAFGTEDSLIRELQCVRLALCATSSS